MAAPSFDPGDRVGNFKPDTEADENSASSFSFCVGDPSSSPLILEYSADSISAISGRFEVEADFPNPFLNLLGVCPKDNPRDTFQHWREFIFPHHTGGKSIVFDLT